MRFDPTAFIFAAVVALLGVAIIIAPPKSGVTETNYERVETGMTVRQVSAILGDGTVNKSLFRVDVGPVIIMSYTNSPRMHGDDTLVIKLIFIGGIVYQKALKKNGKYVSQEGDWI